MLGWDVLVFRSGVELPRDNPWEAALARWSTGISGLAWIQALVQSGHAHDLGGDGYPWRFRVRAGHLLQAIAHGLPANDSPPVYADDYVLPAGFNGPLKFNADQVAACGPDEELDVEAWDQS